MEENIDVNSEGGMSGEGPDLGKFKSVDALLHAYGQLEAEFTRRSQRLKALEQRLNENGGQAAPAEEPPRAATEERPVPLMGAGGAGVVAPPRKCTNIGEAGALALEYFKRANQ